MGAKLTGFSNTVRVTYGGTNTIHNGGRYNNEQGISAPVAGQQVQAQPSRPPQRLDSAPARRTRLAEILVTAGYNRYRVLSAVGFPSCTGFTWGTIRADRQYVGNAKPDDDFALRYSFPRRNRGQHKTFEGSDLRRLARTYERAYFVFNERIQAVSGRGANARKTLLVGETRIDVMTFDGWGSFWQNKTWRIAFTFDNNTVVTLRGGNGARAPSSVPIPSPEPPGYFTTGPHFADHYPNGYAYVPAPGGGWYMPFFLDPGEPLTGN